MNTGPTLGCFTHENYRFYWLTVCFRDRLSTHTDIICVCVCTLLYYFSPYGLLFFYPVSSRSVDAIFPIAAAHFLSLCHIW